MPRHSRRIPGPARLLVTVVGMSLGASPLFAAQSPTVQLVADGILSGGEPGAAPAHGLLQSHIGAVVGSDSSSATGSLSPGLFATQQHLNLLLPHQAPTINPVVSPTATAAQTLTGTKATATALWLNGVPIIPLNAATTWSHALTLTEGANILTVLTQDYLGNASATITTAILLDRTPRPRRP